MSAVVNETDIFQILEQLGIETENNGASTGGKWFKTRGERIDSISPVDGKLIASVNSATEADYEAVVLKAQEAFAQWRLIPAPKRGEVVRQLAERIRFYKEPLGKLVSYEMGKSLQEGLGEVQEMIDICDFAVGLSRQLYGLTMHSERPGHRMYEQYHPLGIVGIISAFNFPVAVWNWNTALAWVCGDVCIRLGRSLLELGGNNAIIITPTADLKMVVPGAVFGAVGTAGQRCTSTRRLIIHDSIYDKVRDALVKAYGQLKIGDPLDQTNHVGPLIDKDAVSAYLNAIEKAKAEGGKVIVEGGVLSGAGYESGCYVKPAIVEAENHFEIVQHETFAPILYIMKYSGDVESAIRMQNNVPQGLSSAIMTNNLKEAEAFLSQAGSDCGIANVNIGTSGAEIGGAFGGEKETGGGRESGSDSWKIYMRRQTNTINYSDSLPLAQGIKFDL